MPELWLPSGGVNRKQKELYLPSGGVNQKQKEIWAGSGGVNRKIFKKGVDYVITPNGPSNTDVDWSSAINSDGSGEMRLIYYGNSSSATFEVGFEISFSEPILFTQNITKTTLTGSLTSTTAPSLRFKQTVNGSAAYFPDWISSSQSVYTITYNNVDATVSKVIVVARGENYNNSSRDFFRFNIGSAGFKIAGQPLLGMQGTIDLPVIGG